MSFSRVLIRIGVHGRRHRISHEYLDTTAWSIKYEHRVKQLEQWMHDHGIGA